MKVNTGQLSQGVVRSTDKARRVIHMSSDPDIVSKCVVDPNDVKLIKDKLFGYSTFWVTKEEPFGDFGEGILFLGNLRGNREDVFAKLQHQLKEVTGDKYNLFVVEELNSEELDPCGGPRVSFGLLRKEVSEPGPTTLWQYVIALLLFFLPIGSIVELCITSQINRLPPEVVKYFTDPNAAEPPDMQLLIPFVESALPLAYGVLGVQLFHEVEHFLAALPKKVKLGIPFFIPNITLELWCNHSVAIFLINIFCCLAFGTLPFLLVNSCAFDKLRFKSILPDRRTMVDISLAGPFAGAALSFSMFCVGLLLSSKLDAAGDLVQVPNMLFQGCYATILIGFLAQSIRVWSALSKLRFKITLDAAVMGSNMKVAMHPATVTIHPLVIAGW
ncbi:hypothetical protein AQUCO_00400733v1 [Aquilegia coerulea]|uniref:Peptidase M50 domain-containing protein n=1 Tax=Aquilegia coerulea TaxID=218851 RepID=A0A2G5EWF0_AQUCA|nr:hypothetical protein AQUCO_00400733v1 [Aquilegia coerulea]